MKSPIIIDIVEKNLCIGCGLCAAFCPQHTLEIKWNHYGEYNPVEMKSCDKECGLCLKVCPFADGNDNEDIIGKTLYKNLPDIYYRPETGYYLDCFVGYAPDTRKRGSSGGMATWFLSTLLKKGIVDYIIAVVPNDDPDTLFKFSILSDPKSVLDSAGSAYYPVELSGILREIQDKSGKCAIIGIPCFIKAIRLATQKNKKLKKRISLTVGLVCGQLKSKHYTEYISTLSGVNERLKKVHFRGKSPEKPASNFYFSCTNKEGAKGKVFWDEGVAEAWVNRWFTINSCRYCDDIFAECAEVTFMDAWLPEYSNDSQGTNIVIVRSHLVQDIIDRGINDDELHLDPILIEKVIQSQAGVIDIKRRYLAYQLYLGHQEGLKMPKKRVAPSKLINPFLRQDINLKNQMQEVSRKIWNPQNQDADHLRAEMRPYLAQLARWNRISRICVSPLKSIRYILRKIRSYSYG